MKKLSYFMIVFLLSIVFVFMDGVKNETKVQAANVQLKVASSNTAATWYIVAAGFTKLFQDKGDQIGWNVQTSGGAVENARLVGTKQVDVGFTMHDVGNFAYNGLMQFKKKAFPNLRLLCGGNVMHYHLVTREGLGIKNVRDLKGKKIYFGTPGAASHNMNMKILDLAGYKSGVDYQGMHLSLGDAIEALKDGDIHAVGHISGVPIPGIMDLFTTKPGVFVKIDDEILISLEKEMPFWPKGMIPANSYHGQNSDVATVEIGTAVITHSDLSDDMAYTITKTIVENSKDYVSIHRACEEFNLESTLKAARASGIPFHPGTEKYLKEIGAVQER